MQCERQREFRIEIYRLRQPGRRLKPAPSDLNNYYDCKSAARRLGKKSGVQRALRAHGFHRFTRPLSAHVLKRRLAAHSSSGAFRIIPRPERGAPRARRRPAVPTGRLAAAALRWSRRSPADGGRRRRAADGDRPCAPRRAPDAGSSTAINGRCSWPSDGGDGGFVRSARYSLPGGARQAKTLAERAPRAGQS